MWWNVAFMRWFIHFSLILILSQGLADHSSLSVVFEKENQTCIIISFFVQTVDSLNDLIYFFCDVIRCSSSQWMWSSILNFPDNGLMHGFGPKETYKWRPKNCQTIKWKRNHSFSSLLKCVNAFTKVLSFEANATRKQLFVNNHLKLDGKTCNQTCATSNFLSFGTTKQTLTCNDATLHHWDYTIIFLNKRCRLPFFVWAFWRTEDLHLVMFNMNFAWPAEWSLSITRFAWWLLTDEQIQGAQLLSHHHPGWFRRKGLHSVIHC